MTSRYLLAHYGATSQSPEREPGALERVLAPREPEAPCQMVQERDVSHGTVGLGDEPGVVQAGIDDVD